MLVEGGRELPEFGEEVEVEYKSEESVDLDSNGNNTDEGAD